MDYFANYNSYLDQDFMQTLENVAVFYIFFTFY